MSLILIYISPLTAVSMNNFVSHVIKSLKLYVFYFKLRSPPNISCRVFCVGLNYMH